MKKSIRKLSGILAVLLVLLSFPAFPAKAEETYIRDEAGILGEEGVTALNHRAEKVSEKYDCGVYIITLSEGVSDIETTAEQLYETEQLGEGSDREGVLLVLDMADRSYAIYTNGENATSSFSTYSLEDSFLDDFGEDNWMAGCAHFIETCERELKAESGAADASRLQPFLIILGCSSGVSGLICFILWRMMKSVHKARTAGEYRTGSLHLTGQRDFYTHTTVSRVHMERPNSDSGNSGGNSSVRSGHF